MIRQAREQDQWEQRTLLQAVLLAAELDVEAALSLLLVVPPPPHEQKVLQKIRRLGPIGQASLEEMLDGLIDAEALASSQRASCEGGDPGF